MARLIKYLVIHTTASSQACTAADEQRYFLDDLKWKVGGYHKMVEADGRAVRLHPDETITNGTYPFLVTDIQISNRNALHVAWIGGIDEKKRPIDNRTELQKATLRNLVFAWLSRYPQLKVLGHGQVRNKSCPCFNVPAWCKAIGVPAQNIYWGDHFGNLLIEPWRSQASSPPRLKGGETL